MAKFRECPRCHNYERGYTVYRCLKCGKHWCYKSKLLGASGCGSSLGHCPGCGSLKKVGVFSSSFEVAGSIG